MDDMLAINRSRRATVAWGVKKGLVKFPKKDAPERTYENAFGLKVDGLGTIPDGVPDVPFKAKSTHG